MTQNVGTTDKRARTAFGAVLGTVSLATLAGALPLSGIVALVSGVAAAMMLGTAVTGTCGLYALLGVDTCSVSHSDSR